MNAIAIMASGPCWLKKKELHLIVVVVVVFWMILIAVITSFSTASFYSKINQRSLFLPLIIIGYYLTIYPWADPSGPLQSGLIIDSFLMANSWYLCWDGL